MALIWLTELLLVLTVPIGVLRILSHLGKADFAPVLAQGLGWILLAVLLRWLAGRRLRRKRPELCWLPWRERIWLTVVPLLMFAAAVVMVGLICGDAAEGPVVENEDIVVPFLAWAYTFTVFAAYRIIANVFSRQRPDRGDPAVKAAKRLAWVSELLLSGALLLSVERFFLFLREGFVACVLVLVWGLVLIAAAARFRWLAEKRQRRARPELCWLPWRKRILLTLIPLLACAPVCVVTGIYCYDYDLGIYWHGMPTDLLTVLHQWFSIATVVLIRVLDNMFSHREPDPAAPAADAE